jgi:hypothetical protein
MAPYHPKGVGQRKQVGSRIVMVDTQSQATTATVRELRLTCVSTRSVGSMIGRATVGTESGYVGLFDASLGPDATMRRPWVVPTKRGRKPSNRFWMHYLGGTSLESVNGAKAWSSVLPLRVAGPWRVVDTEAEFRLSAETLIYPFGVCGLLSATLSSPAALDRAIDQLLALMNTKGRVSANGSNLNFLAVVERLVDAAAAAAGATLDSESTRVDPITIVTFTQTSGVDPSAAPSEAIRQAVYGAAAGIEDWRTIQVPPPVDTDLTTSTKGRHKGDVLLATDRGRAVWFPQSSGRPENTSALGCYHRNLVLGSAQVDAMGALMRFAASKLSDGVSHLSLDADLRQMIERTALELAGLWVGEKETTYRSSSFPRQIDDQWVTSLKGVLARFGLPPLPSPLPPTPQAGTDHPAAPPTP